MSTLLEKFSHFVHARFIWLLIASYIIAALFPSIGLWARGVSAGSISLPMMLLGFLLFNAGMGVQLAELKKLRHNPFPLLCGLLANLGGPITFIAVTAMTMQLWHNSDEVQNILVGLALVASMPIAGSSTAWSQNANGNLALSLGLVLLTTFLSPLSTPAVLHSVGWMTQGDYAEDLHELAGAQAGRFLLIAVIVPSILGIVCHHTIGKDRAVRCRANLKLANAAILLFLNYSNASVSLPQVFANPDADFLAVTVTISAMLCIVGFLAGWFISKVARVDLPDQIAIMFGLGMNNNGSGLVLASMALADHPQVLLPIIFYNLVQHLIAGMVDHFLSVQSQHQSSGQTVLGPAVTHTSIASLDISRTVKSLDPSEL